MVLDPYEGIADRYDLFHGEFGQHAPEVVSFFRQLFEENQLETVLDCACGTGNDLALFHSLGREVVGSDISESMLAQAERNLAQSGLSIPLLKLDYRQLPDHFDRRFDAVMCLSSSILHMPTEVEVVRAFESMRNVLRPGGILVLTQGTTDRQWQEKPRFILAINDRDLSRLFVIDYAGEGATYHVLDIVHTEEDRDFKEWSMKYPRVYLRDDLEKLLKAGGFERVDFYGGYGYEPYDKGTSARLIAVAFKPAVAGGVA
jgi:glycine/sarcosine N-methyltransferase